MHTGTLNHSTYAVIMTNWIDTKKIKYKKKTCWVEHPTGEIKSLLDSTFGHYFWRALLNVNFYITFKHHFTRPFWMSLLDVTSRGNYVTFWLHFWMSHLNVTFECHLWTAPMLKPLEALLPGRLDDTTTEGHCNLQTESAKGLIPWKRRIQTEK